MGKNQEEKKAKANLSWLMGYMKGLKGKYMLAIAGTLLYNALQLVVPDFSRRIINLFLTGENAAENLANHKDLLFWLVGGMIGLTVLRTVIVYFTCMGYESVSQEVLFRIRNRLFYRLEKQDMSFYDHYRTGDLMTRLTGDLDACRHMIAWVLRMTIASFALAGATLIYFFLINWKVALCLMLVMPLIFFVILAFRKQVAPMHALLREKHAAMNTMAQENISGVRVIRAFAREDYEISKFDKVNSEYRETNLKTANTWLKFYPFVDMTSNLLPVVLLVVGGLMLITGQMDMGEYVAFSGLTWALSNPMGNLGNIINEYTRFDAASKKIMEIDLSEPKIQTISEEGAAGKTEEEVKRYAGKITFSHVSFAYEDHPVLKDVSFEIEPGQTVAIMGETGCGKTSLIQLIPRFYDPGEGTVLVDDTDVKTLPVHELRKNIGLATQDVLLYSDTIDSNIAYGDSRMPEERVQRVASLAAASDFINQMPDRFDTIIGERGVGLSGGQKQRIALARALAVRPSILILDDTTSAVDLETEKHIQDSLNNLDFPCTKIIIAQRISSTKQADLILIMKEGEIIERGNHESLVALNGYYADLVRLQEGTA